MFLGLFCVPHLRGTSVRAPGFNTLVDRADFVFTGEMLAQHCEWRVINGRRSLVTLVTFGVERLHKGTAGNLVTLQFLGGTLGEVSLTISEMPKFRDHERVILFVQGNGTAACPVMAFYHGRFALKRENGREIVLKHDGTPLADIAEAGQDRRPDKAPSPSPALTHDDFSNLVRARAALRR